MKECETLGEVVKTTSDEKLGTVLRAEIARAEAISGHDFNDVQVRSVSEMGDAAGRCHMETGEIEIRDDLLSSEEQVRGMVAHVLVHEAEHAEGNGFEGLTELHTSLKTGQGPVFAYREKVASARQLTDSIGVDEALEAARQYNAEILLLQAYIRAESTRSANLDWQELEEITDEGEELIKLAA